MSTTPLSLSDAITAVETAQTSLVNDQQAQQTAQANIDAANAKLTAATAAKTPIDVQLQADAVPFNAALEGLIAAATAAKIPVASVVAAGSEAIVTAAPVDPTPAA